ncbi:MAG: magnesium transporter [Elusimicrobia bacterium]|nr:magnesium transporter [Elusimicrobiota bacterium]
MATMDGLKLYAIFVPDIKNFLETKDFWALKRLLSDISPLDLAEGWHEFLSQEQLVLFRLITINKAVQLFEELDDKDQEFLLQNIREANIESWTPQLSLEERHRLFGAVGVRYFKRLQAKARKKRLPIFTPYSGDWPEHSTGALMQHEYFCVDMNWKASVTLERLKATARLRNVGELYALYVTEAQNKLLGILSLRTLIAAPPDSKVGDIMWPVGLLKLRPEMDQEETARMFTRYNLTSLPVVDQDNKLVGTVTVDDIINVVHQEATEDIAKMAGTTPDELTNKGIGRVIVLRMPWLIITCGGQFLVSHIIKNFEGTISRFIALASFMPFIAAMGGNIGTQSSTIAVRALATGEWMMSDFRRSIQRELLVGIGLGVIYASLAGLLAYWLYGARFGALFPMIVSMGMFTSMSIAALLGAVEPFIFSWFKIDPATATGPLVTTLTDLISVTTYLSVAAWLLR